MSSQLSETLYAEISALCAQGDELMKVDEFDAAKEKYLAALHLLPEDHKNLEAATWIYVAIGDSHFKMGNHEKSFKCFFNAVRCPQGSGNAYIHLRLGQNYFELGKLEKALDELTKALTGGGVEIFAEDDPKYLEFLKKKIDL